MPSIPASKRRAIAFTATLETNLGDEVVAPRGTTLYGRLAQVTSAGRMSGSSDLVGAGKQRIGGAINDDIGQFELQVKGKGEGGNTAKKVVGGAGLGALIGGIAGGGKGAGIGAAAGAVGGTAIAASKKGQQLQIPSETLLEFRLEQPAPLPVAG